MISEISDISLDPNFMIFATMYVFIILYKLNATLIVMTVKTIEYKISAIPKNILVTVLILYWDEK